MLQYSQALHLRRLCYGRLHDRFTEDAVILIRIRKRTLPPELLDQLGEVLEKNPLRRCFEFGWLHNEACSPTEVLYIFASPLHVRYVQWMTLGNLDEGVVAMIRKFIPLNLSPRRTCGTTIQSTPEAQFQGVINLLFKISSLVSTDNWKTVEVLEVTSVRIDHHCHNV
jgi:hypothetical protein